ncbi:MAG TPA: hypothetical protein VHY08_08090, partial [Bacillota bacterium]|nr:hypothetical protein [Bacillota bacterium]
MPNSKIDEVIQEALGDGANEIEFDADLFPDIKAGVFSPSRGRARFYDISLAIGKKILLTAGAISILFLACALFSKDVRVMATELYNAVKTIFVVEGTADNYQVVEKPVEDQLFTHGVSQETQLSDSEISQKVGYHVSFPYV